MSGCFLAGVVAEKGDVVGSVASGGEEADHGPGLDPLLINDLFEHGLGLLEQFCGLYTHYFILQDLGVAPFHLPGLEEGAPIDVVDQLCKRIVVKHLDAGLLGRDRLDLIPVGGDGIGAGIRQADQFALLLLGQAPLPGLGVFVLDAGGIGRALAFGEQAAGHAHGAGGIRHIDCRTLVFRGDLYRGMDTGGGGAADEQRGLEFQALHLLGHVHDLVQGGCD